MEVLVCWCSEVIGVSNEPPLQRCQCDKLRDADYEGPTPNIFASNLHQTAVTLRIIHHTTDEGKQLEILMDSEHAMEILQKDIFMLVIRLSRGMTKQSVGRRRGRTFASREHRVGGERNTGNILNINTDLHHFDIWQMDFRCLCNEDYVAAPIVLSVTNVHYVWQVK
ncbi:uncharacterized protein LOC113497659 [Trichoplusia ni]|uniref:Uncharacterized protein LOC113497659 n=1 Tax=Trichoplusia ni TaxID=7111 RepID=A0A7E5VXR9_TRINI|nr:uncharacterized protein LOC113497659 [Trichoplusia ni]